MHEPALVATGAPNRCSVAMSKTRMTSHRSTPSLNVYGGSVASTQQILAQLRALVPPSRHDAADALIDQLLQEARGNFRSAPQVQTSSHTQLRSLTDAACLASLPIDLYGYTCCFLTVREHKRLSASCHTLRDRDASPDVWQCLTFPDDYNFAAQGLQALIPKALVTTEWFAGVRELNLAWTQVGDVRPLSTLVSLKKLNLSGC